MLDKILVPQGGIRNDARSDARSSLTLRYRYRYVSLWRLPE